MSKFELVIEGIVLAVADKPLFVNSRAGFVHSNVAPKTLDFYLPDVRKPSFVHWDDVNGRPAKLSSHYPLLLVPSLNIIDTTQRPEDGQIFLRDLTAPGFYHVYALDSEIVSFEFDATDVAKNPLTIDRSGSDSDIVNIPQLQIMAPTHATARRTLKTSMAGLAAKASLAVGKCFTRGFDPDKWTLSNWEDKNQKPNRRVGNQIGISLSLAKAPSISLSGKKILLNAADAVIWLVNEELNSLIFYPSVAASYEEAFVRDPDLQGIYPLIANNYHAGELVFLRQAPISRTEKVCAPAFAEKYEP